MQTSFRAPLLLCAVLGFAACNGQTSTLGTIRVDNPQGGASGQAGAAGSAGRESVAGASGASAGVGGSVAIGGAGGQPFGGRGGTASAGASGQTSAGTGGIGGSPAAAGAAGQGGTSYGPLVVDGPARRIDIAGADIRRERSPLLVADDDPARATLVFQAFSYPGGITMGLRYVPLQPFGDWPTADFGPVFGEGPSAIAEPIAAAPSFGPGVTLLVHELGLGAETGAATLLSGAPPYAAPVAKVLRSADATQPVFASRGKEGHAVSYRLSSDGPDGTRQILRGGVVTKAGVYQEDKYLTENACATAPLLADAISFDDGFLVAQSTSRTCCSCDDAFDGPPVAVVVRRSNHAGTGAGFWGQDPVSFLRLVPRSDGAWLIMGRTSLASGTTISVGRLDLDANVAAAPEPVPGLVFGAPIAVTALGDDLAIGTVELGPKPSGQAVVVRVLGADGSLTSITEASPEMLLGEGPLAMLGDVTGTKLVVAFSQPSQAESGAARIRLLRFTRSAAAPF